MIPGDDRDILSAGRPDEPSGDGARRRRRRIGALGAAAAVAVALVIVSVAHARHAPKAPPPVVPVPAVTGPVISATSVSQRTALFGAPGTVLASCVQADAGQTAVANLPPNWRRWSVRAGPLWFANLGGHGTAGSPAGRAQSAKPVLYVVTVVVTGIKPGTAVVVRATPAGRPYLRFLYGPVDSLNAGTVYTMNSGESGVTFPMCPQGPGNAEPLTDFYGGLLVAGARCVPVDVWPPGHRRAITINLGACH